MECAEINGTEIKSATDSSHLYAIVRIVKKSSNDSSHTQKKMKENAFIF